jgi:hypothetical protein
MLVSWGTISKSPSTVVLENLPFVVPGHNAVSACALTTCYLVRGRHPQTPKYAITAVIDLTQTHGSLTVLSPHRPQHGVFRLHQCSRQVYSHHPVANSDRAGRCWQEADGGADNGDNPTFGRSSGCLHTNPASSSVRSATGRRAVRLDYSHRFIRRR